MPDFDRSPDGLAFSSAVQTVQRRLGSRRMFEDAEWPIDVSRDLEAFITAQRSVFLASASAEGQPYVQHRGGPPGFLKVLDSRTIGMADLRGNRQYVTLGNLTENDRVELFLIDYRHRQRVKIWGRGRIVEDDPGLVARLMPEGVRGRAERALLIAVEAWDVNCPQHIPSASRPTRWRPCSPSAMGASLSWSMRSPRCKGSSRCARSAATTCGSDRGSWFDTGSSPGRAVRSKTTSGLPTTVAGHDRFEA